ncbi:alpha/beta-hydrolase [Tilletiaria anomala UBC 951]|uniref:Alpha/beta-hydrolase n=1 Tax=Tilletiaria anomala (strain ATCC 24038 / CBS 436.72 / UBC 951) TaxID=1037660 RepID=A0A066VL92_TILAU|nr:alpha/beta-hydrolase [Tilletiaria anomala UBC 951]KDN41068.1 alpha/beta-hydrolase [Tilletiaria anomala UBC 951]
MGESSKQGKKAFKYGGSISKTEFDIGGLPINVFGMDELTPVYSRASAAPPPPVCVIIHMHGRTGSANNEEHIARQLYDRIDRCKRQTTSQGYTGPQKDVLVVSFDARNHGHRKTNELGQKGWKEDNKRHAMDLYAMYVGTARDVSFLIDFLPAYLFPHDERVATQWVATGKSLGGHAAWKVLADERRVTIGVPFIGMPDYLKLLARRTQSNFVPNAPPTVPGALRQLIAQIDPAQARGYDSFDPTVNPFWDKKILVCSGEEDRLVKWEYSEEFLRRLVVEEPSGPRGEMQGLKIFKEPGVGHVVTENMIEEAGEWIWSWGVSRC